LVIDRTALFKSGGFRGTSIAVLPFVDLSEKHDQEYFADGMAEEILNLLVKLPNVKIIGRTSSFQFRGKSDDLRKIGAALGATYLVEGSLRQSGDRVRVTAQLVDARDGTRRWSDNYDRHISDVLKVQGEIAASLARALQLSISDDTAAYLPLKNAQAYNQYLLGIHALDGESLESCKDAVAAFQQALDLEPGFARAALGLASAYQIIGENGWGSTTTAYEHARQAAKLAISLDPGLGAAHARLANVLTMYDWDWAAADAEIKLADRLGAGVEAILAAAHLAAARGDWDKAAQLFKKGLSIDPLNQELHGDLGYEVYLRSGNFVNAETSLRRALEISPQFGAGKYFLGLSLLFQDRLNEALDLMQAEGPGLRENGVALVSYAMGRKAESAIALERMIETDSGWASGIAENYAYRGDIDKAFSWLDRA
jgi:TolB-like protein/Tfp pilus assembly protein PilF